MQFKWNDIHKEHPQVAVYKRTRTNKHKKHAANNMRKVGMVDADEMRAPPPAVKARRAVPTGTVQAPPVVVNRSSSGQPPLSQPERTSEPTIELRAAGSRTPRKAPLPKTRGEIKHHKPVDRIEQNRVDAQKPLPPKPKVRVTKVAKASPRKHENFGHVPAYLDQRKRQLQAEAEAKKAKVE